MQNNTDKKIFSKTAFKKLDYKLNSSIYYNFDGKVESIYKLFHQIYPNGTQNIELGYTLCVGSLINVYHTIIIRGYNLADRRDTINSILSPISSSIIHTIYGNSKEELSTIKATHKILRVANFKKNIELVKMITKAGQEGIIYKGIRIQKLTVIADAYHNEIPDEFKNNCLILEVCNNYIKPKSIKNIPETYAEKVKTNHNSKKENILAREFLKTLNSQIQIDISTKKSIESKLNMIYPKHNYFHVVFIDLVKIITFLNQNKRKSYIIKDKNNNIEERVYISDVEDVRWCFEIVKDIFIKNCLDLPDRYLEMVNYIIGWVENDPIICESKVNKNIPEDWDDYFEGMDLINDYIKYLKIHEDKKEFLRNERRFREYLLHLSDHKEKGKFKFLHSIQEGNKNKFKLIDTPLIKFFDFNKEYQDFYEEYLDFLQYITENKDRLSLKLEFEI